MKRQLFITLLLLAFFQILPAQAASPLLVGRRGCAYGVENSREAFERGADMGYKMMECHVRMTADSVYVAAHDGKTARLGGKLNIATSPLDTLLTETYTQTIGPNTYTGRLMTVSDYLDFCRERGLTPLLHLKTMTKKDTDTTPLPGLVELIDSKGMRGETIIITSSKSYTDYFLNNAPGLKLIFQADGKWRKHLPWILERKLDVDIKDEYIDAETVAAFHDNGLKIITWTVNEIPDYRRLSGLGVDMMITDNLPPRAMP